MTLAGKDFWALKRGKDLADEVRAKAKRYFDACEEMGLIDQWRDLYRFYFMRDPLGKHGFSQNSSRLGLGSRQKPEVSIQVAEVRSLIQQQQSFILSEPVTFQVVASTGEQRSVMSSEVGEKALNYVYDERCRPSMREFVKLTLQYGMPATHIRWNSKGGDDVPADAPAFYPQVDAAGNPHPLAGQPMVQPDGIPDPNTGQLVPNPNAGQPITHKVKVKSGAPYVDVLDPTFYAMDPIIGPKANWMIGFERTNLFILAAKYPERAEEILAQSTRDEYESYRLSPGKWSQMYGHDEGEIIVMHFYYADSEELPGGRYQLIVGDLVVTEDEEPCPLPAGRLPIRPLLSDKYTDCAMSSSNSFSYMPLEEALNRLRGSELSNLAYYGKQTRYRTESQRVVPGDDGQTREIVGARGDDPPTMLAIQPMPKASIAAKEDLQNALPRISGYSDVSRGTRVEQTTSGKHAQVFEAISARNLSMIIGDVKNHETELANDMLSLMQNYGNTAFIAEIAGADGSAIAREFSPQDLSTLRRLVAKAVPEAMRGSMARLELVELTKDIEDPRERAKAIQMVLRGDDEYGKNDRRCLNLIAIENERLISGSIEVVADIDQNHVAHMTDHQAAKDYLLSQENPDGQAVMRISMHINQHSEFLQNADPVKCKALGYPDPPILPGNNAFIFAQRMQQAQMMLMPEQTPDPITGKVDANNPAIKAKQEQAAQAEKAPSGPPQAA